MPDAAKWLAFFDGVYDTSRNEGIPQAMQQFANGVLGSADRQALVLARREHPNESNTKFAKALLDALGSGSR